MIGHIFVLDLQLAILTFDILQDLVVSFTSTSDTLIHKREKKIQLILKIICLKTIIFSILYNQVVDISIPCQIRINFQLMNNSYIRQSYNKLAYKITKFRSSKYFI